MQLTANPNDAPNPATVVNRMAPPRAGNTPTLRSDHATPMTQGGAEYSVLRHKWLNRMQLDKIPRGIPEGLAPRMG